MSTPVSHPLVGAYLRDLETLLRGLEPGERAEVLAGVHEHLAISLGPDASDDAVRRALGELGTPQSVADEAHAGLPAHAVSAHAVSAHSVPAHALPAPPPPSAWPPRAACLVNALLLVLVLLLGWMRPHGMEWVALGAFLTVPWFVLVVLTSLTAVWSSGQKLRSVVLVPGTVLALAVLTSVLGTLPDRPDLPLRLLVLAAVLSAAWVLVGLVRSGSRRTD